MGIEKIINLKEHEYATTLAGFVATISTIAFGALGLISKPINYPLELIFTAIGTLATVGVALLCDHVLDEAEIYEKDRLAILGGGYLIFSLLMGLLIFGLLYIHGGHYEMNGCFQPTHIIVSGLAALMLIAKAMTKTPSWPLWGIIFFVPLSYLMPIIHKCINT